jgi:membrane protease YdiL (CAAX protease family)
MIQTSDSTGDLRTPGAPTEARKRRGRKPPGAIAQLILFLSIWGTVVPILGLAAAWPTLADALRRSGMVGQDGRLSPNVDTDQLNALMMATSGTTLAIAAATALGTIVSVWIMQRFFRGPSLLDLGLRFRPGWLADSAIGLVLGPVMFLAILLVMLAAGWASTDSGTIGAAGLLTAFVTYVFVAFAEEVFARGWVFQVLERGRGTTVAAVGSAAIFSLLHAFNPGFGLTALIGLFLAGLLFAQAYVVTRQLWLPIVLHLSWNFSEGPLFGFPVSGMASEGLMTVIPHGPEVVTGGPFGPEAGLIVFVGIAIASAALYALGRWRAGRATAEPAAMSSSG